MTTKKVTVRIDEDDWDKLKRLLHKKGQTITGFLRTTIKKLVK